MISSYVITGWYLISIYILDADICDNAVWLLCQNIRYQSERFTSNIGLRVMVYIYACQRGLYVFLILVLKYCSYCQSQRFRSDVNISFPDINMISCRWGHKALPNHKRTHIKPVRCLDLTSLQVIEKWVLFWGFFFGGGVVFCTFFSKSEF